MNYAIITDSSSNLPTQFLDQHGIPVIPLAYYIDNVEHTCTDLSAFDGEAFYGKLRERPEVRTSLVNVQAFVTVFERFLKAGRDILYIAMSSGISGTYQSGALAAEQLREQYPERKIIAFDTLAASLGEGLFVVTAAEMREAGASIEEVAAKLMEMRPKMRQIFTVDDLMYLRHGGRLSGVSAVFGTVLNIKPLLTANAEGKIVILDKIRGRKRALKALADIFAEKARTMGAVVAAIAHAGCPEDAGYLAGLLKGVRSIKEMLIECYEPVTGSHVGPGAVALFFWSD